jgi:flagellar biosynthetic protein FliO
MESALAVIRVLLSLGLVVVLSWLFMRLLLPRLVQGGIGRQTQLQLVERLPVGLRSYLCLVRLGERVFLLGVSAAQITLLAEIPAGSLHAGTERAAGQPDFAAILQRNRGRAASSLQDLSRKYGRTSPDCEKRGEEDV